MNTRIKSSSAVMALVALSALAVQVRAADEEIVTTGDTTKMTQWYGRAGGLAGSDRVGNLTVSPNKLGVSYDSEVATRTNMPKREGDVSVVHVTYDPEYVARTNMTRGKDTAPKSYASPGQK